MKLKYLQIVPNSLLLIYLRMPSLPLLGDAMELLSRLVESACCLSLTGGSLHGFALFGVHFIMCAVLFVL